MTRHSPDLDHHRLLQLSDEVGRISTTLAQLSMGLGEPPADIDQPSEQVREISEESVRWIINARKLRSRFLPKNLFSDPAWDMLLELLRAEIAQHRISVSSLCLASNAPPTTALRYIQTMVKQGLMMRDADPFDGRRVHISLTPAISRALRDYCACVFEKPVADAWVGRG